MRDAIAFISKKYFDGHEMLFPEVADGFDVTVKYLEELAEVYNNEVMSMGRHKRRNGRLIDPGSLQVECTQKFGCSYRIPRGYGPRGQLTESPLIFAPIILEHILVHCHFALRNTGPSNSDDESVRKSLLLVSYLSHLTIFTVDQQHDDANLIVLSELLDHPHGEETPSVYTRQRSPRLASKRGVRYGRV